MSESQSNGMKIFFASCMLLSINRAVGILLSPIIAVSSCSISASLAGNCIRMFCTGFAGSRLSKLYCSTWLIESSLQLMPLIKRLEPCSSIIFSTCTMCFSSSLMKVRSVIFSLSDFGMKSELILLCNLLISSGVISS